MNNKTFPSAFAFARSLLCQVARWRAGLVLVFAASVVLSAQTSKAPGASKQTSKAPAPSNMGAWHYSSSVDPMTDAESIFYSLSSQTGGAKLVMTIDCSTGKFLLSVGTDFHVRDKEYYDMHDSDRLQIATCKLRYDKETPIEEIVGVSDETLIVFGDSIEKANKLATCKIFAIEMPTLRSTRTATFTLNGLAAAIGQMEKKSGLKRNSWRSR